MREVSAFSNVTNPKPRERFVFRSTRTMLSRTGPNCSKKEWNSSFVTVQSKARDIQTNTRMRQYAIKLNAFGLYCRLCTFYSPSEGKPPTNSFRSSFLVGGTKSEGREYGPELACGWGAPSGDFGVERAPPVPCCGLELSLHFGGSVAVGAVSRESVGKEALIVDWLVCVDFYVIQY